MENDEKNKKGYKDMINDILPDSFILNALREDIETKPQNRTKELELAMKIKQWDKVTLNIEKDDKFEENSSSIRELVDELKRRGAEIEHMTESDLTDELERRRAEKDSIIES